MGLEKNVKRGGLAGLVLVAAFVLPSCAINVTFREGNEKINSSAFIVPLVAGVVEAKHDIYKTVGQEEVVCAFDSRVKRSLFENFFEMAIHGPDREELWRYRIEPTGKDKGRFKFWDSNKKESDWIYSVPNFLPAQVKVNMWGSSFSDLSGEIKYSNAYGGWTDPRELLREDIIKRLRERQEK